MSNDYSTILKRSDSKDVRLSNDLKDRWPLAANKETEIKVSNWFENYCLQHGVGRFEFLKYSYCLLVCVSSAR